ncbi:ABC transporter substrate-binding protein [Arsukibacterium ikkense]|uniref:ABC transporter substrate-binding protein n=1 Tax=Arsukibacterium ikkense TaxID=336831 RepID=A0A0M2V812_9GAMM|nr:ABC transporter substrate-binding protein [Arsukibacterium ikkense]
MLLLATLLPTVQAEQGATPKRIIALAPHITELLYAIGAGEQLVGVSAYSDYPTEAQVLPQVANYAGINLEAVLALQPDLVVAWKTGNVAADVSRLQQFGIRVAFSDPLLIADVADELRYLGQLTGRQQRAEQVAVQFETELAAISAEYQPKKRLKVFFSMGTEPLTSVANAAWPAQALQLCAGDNIMVNAKNDYPQPGIEQVLQAQPEVIIQATAGAKPAAVSFWSPYPVIPAVALEQFVTVDADLLYRTSPRTLQGIRQLCQGLDQYRQ